MIERLRKLNEKATPIGWWTRFKIPDYIVSGPGDPLNELAFLDSGDDAQLIALSRNMIPDLLELYDLSPKGCVCHVSSSDGYHGTSHTEKCDRHRALIKKLQGEVK